MDEDYEIPEVQDISGDSVELENYKIISLNNKRHLQRYLEIVSDPAADMEDLNKNSWLDCYSPNCDDNDYEPIESPPPSLLVGRQHNL